MLAVRPQTDCYRSWTPATTHHDLPAYYTTTTWRCVNVIVSCSSRSMRRRHHSTHHFHCCCIPANTWPPPPDLPPPPGDTGGLPLETPCCRPGHAAAQGIPWRHRWRHSRFRNALIVPVQTKATMLVWTNVTVGLQFATLRWWDVVWNCKSNPYSLING